VLLAKSEEAEASRPLFVSFRVSQSDFVLFHNEGLVLSGSYIAARGINPNQPNTGGGMGWLSLPHLNIQNFKKK
jgi:hypothetical protein